MRLSQVQDFIAVAEHGSIRAGARARDVSAPALTKSIRQLEEELHVPLLTRTTRGPAHVLLPAVVKRFRVQHPDVLVCIDSWGYPTHLDELRSGVMDMAVSPVPDEGIEREFTCEPLYNNDSVVMAHREHPLRNARSLRELIGSDWILTGQRMHGPGAAILDAFRERDLPLPRVAVRCDTIGMIEHLMQDRHLLCMLPRQMVAGRLAANGLVPLPIEDKLPSHTVSLIYRADSPMTPVAAQFATLLRREVHYLSNLPDSPLRRLD